MEQALFNPLGELTVPKAQRNFATKENLPTYPEKIAALKAEGNSTILDISHIDRGYADFEGKLKKLGAKIRRIKV